MSLPHPLWCAITGLGDGCNATGFPVVALELAREWQPNGAILLVCAGNRLERAAVTPKNHKATICYPHADYEGRHRTFRSEKWTYGNQVDWHPVPNPPSVGPAAPIAVGPKRLPLRPGPPNPRARTASEYLQPLPHRDSGREALRAPAVDRPRKSGTGFGQALCGTGIAPETTRDIGSGDELGDGHSGTGTDTAPSEVPGAPCGPASNSTDDTGNSPNAQVSLMTPGP